MPSASVGGLSPADAANALEEREKVLESVRLYIMESVALVSECRGHAEQPDNTCDSCQLSVP
jgi:hypothetical protein